MNTRNWLRHYHLNWLREKRGQSLKRGCCRALAGQKQNARGEKWSSPHSFLKCCRTRTLEVFCKPLCKTVKSYLYHVQGFIRTPFSHMHPTAAIPPLAQSPHQEMQWEQQHMRAKWRCQRCERSAKAGYPAHLLWRRRENECQQSQQKANMFREQSWGQPGACQKRNCPLTAEGRKTAIQESQGEVRGKQGWPWSEGHRPEYPNFTWAHLSCYSIMDLSAEKRIDSVCREPVSSGTIKIIIPFLFWWHAYRNLYRVATVIHFSYFKHWV